MRRRIGSAARLVFGGSLLVVTGCTGGDGGTHADVDEPGPSVAATVALSADGDSLGPIGRTTPFEAEELKRLFPGATITAAVGSAEGEPYSHYRVEVHGSARLDVRSTDGVSIQSVEILEGAAASAAAPFGRSYAAVFEGVDEPDCRPGMEDDSGLVLCEAPFTSHITLMFAGSWNGPDGVLPSKRILTNWTVERVIWQP